MPLDSISEYQFKIFLGGMPPDSPSICMLCMKCTLQLHTMLTTLTQNFPDQFKFASYTPDAKDLKPKKNIFQLFDNIATHTKISFQLFLSQSIGKAAALT